MYNGIIMNPQIIEKKYINLVSQHLENFTWKKETLANCRCCVCGDSATNKKRARGYFYLSKNRRFRFKCQNCSINWSAEDLIKYVSPAVHDEYRLEYLKEMGVNTRKHTPKPTGMYGQTKFVSGVVTNGRTDIPKELETLTPITILPVFHSVYKYLKQDRLIPADKLERLYYTDNLQQFVALLAHKYNHKIDDITEKYPCDARIIIPTVDRRGNLISLAARATPGNTQTKLRYITVKLDEFASKIYGMDFADFSKPLHCVEGQIDSLYLPNCVAVGGSSLHMLESLLPDGHNMDITYIHDNQPRNKEIVREVKKTIDSGCKVVIWESNSAMKYGKDIGTMVEYGMSLDKLRWEVHRRTFSEIEAQIEFGKWAKV